MPLSKFLPFLILIGSLISCSSSKIYRPFSNGYGWSDYDLAPDRSEISYSGRVGDNLTHLKKLALIRAAEVGKAKQFKYVRVLQSQAYLVRGVSFELLEKANEPAPLSFRANENSIILKDTSAKSIVVSEKKAPNARLEVRLSVRFCDKDCDSFLEIRQILSNAERDGWIKD